MYRVILPVSDIKKASMFYSTLLGMKGVRVSAGRHYFNCGGTILACYDAKADGDDVKFSPNPEHIYISTSDIKHLYNIARTLKCKKIDNKIGIMPWGERCFYLTDPFGNKLCI